MQEKDYNIQWNNHIPVENHNQNPTSLPGIPHSSHEYMLIQTSSKILLSL